jgi:cell division protease FtsH
MSTPEQGATRRARWWRRFFNPARRPQRMRVWILAIVVTLGLNYWLASRATQAPPRVRVPYSPFFLGQVQAGHVRQITSTGSAIQGTFRKPLRYAGSRASTRFTTEIPSFADGDALTKLLQDKGVVVNAVSLQAGVVWWKSLLFGFGPTIAIVALLVWFLRRARSSGGMLGGLGRSKARRYAPSEGSVVFADVAGIDEAKAELSEVVDFLRNPDKYRRLGGRIPGGVLLSGPPGTGKTLLARAVAGEAEVPFFSMSASEFVEAIVGIGASRVRDLFVQAKAVAPSIVFVDELDAIGRARSSGGGFGAGSDEREQTLNQILTEMDGFDPDTKVIVIAATNRPDILDSALLRPGRFDRRVAVQAPDRVGRRMVLEVHTRSMPLAPDVDLDRLAATTPGMVGADLANIVNEAALLAARRNQENVAQADFADALERIVLGAERQLLMRPEDRRRTAYHEAGHALVGMLTEGADPVRKISIIPRGSALGVTFSAPDADRFNYTEQELYAKIALALGGRAAEELVFGDRTTGAESDIRQLSEIARHMVGTWGMSAEVGMVAVTPDEGRGPFGFVGSGAHSERTQELVDAEVRRIVGESYDSVLALLSENRTKLDALAEALLEHETLDQDAAYAAAGVGPVQEPESVQLAG